jgi:hypothetical protein
MSEPSHNLKEQLAMIYKNPGKVYNVTEQMKCSSTWHNLIEILDA